ncbi:MAG: hypothetical protein ACI3W6_01570 [Clostridia bacterium]
MKHHCEDCGIYDAGKKACWKFSVKQRDCAYYTPIEYDGEEPLTPEEHWMLKILDMKNRSMQGPV